jgi:hypothetical protein
LFEGGNKSSKTAAVIDDAFGRKLKEADDNEILAMLLK